jgi:hypothetical protein
MNAIQKAVLALSATIIVAADAHAGRWLSRDPIEEGAGFVQRDPMPEMDFTPYLRNEPNLYVFVANNPINATDTFFVPWNSIASTYDSWIINGFCIPGFNCPPGQAYNRNVPHIQRGQKECP